jgi:hypothetical protein
VQYDHSGHSTEAGEGAEHSGHVAVGNTEKFYFKFYDNNFVRMMLIVKKNPSFVNILHLAFFLSMKAREKYERLM